MTKWQVLMPAMYPIELLRRPVLRAMVSALHEQRALTPLTRVLDVGCGIGSLLLELSAHGCQLTGADPTGSMLRVARRRLRGATLLQEPAHALRSVGSRSQDISIVSGTLHGFAPEYRRQVYAELRRVTRELVGVIDYHSNRSLLVAAIEWLENSDYFNFVDVVSPELQEAFGAVQVVCSKRFESLYLCWLDSSQPSAQARAANPDSGGRQHSEPRAG